jgi:hypothetical protein
VCDTKTTFKREATPFQKENKKKKRKGGRTLTECSTYPPGLYANIQNVEEKKKVHVRVLYVVKKPATASLKDNRIRRHYHHHHRWGPRRDFLARLAAAAWPPLLRPYSQP